MFGVQDGRDSQRRRQEEQDEPADDEERFSHETCHPESKYAVPILQKRTADWKILAEEQAREVEQAVEQVLERGYRTPDLARGGEDIQVVGTDRMGDLVAARILGRDMP